MQILGEVQAIINNEMLLVSCEESLKPDEILNVFAALTDDRLKKLGLEQLFIPKGEIRIVCEQAKNLYLARTFRDVREKRTKVQVPSQLQKSIMGIAGVLQPHTKEVVEEVVGPPSAKLDEAKSLALEISKAVTKGDLVGRI